MDNYILAGDERQAALEAAKAAFLRQGGEIKVLDSFVYQPLPPRNHPEPKPKVKKESSVRQAKQEVSQARADMIAELAKTMTCSEVAKELGVQPDSLYSVAKRYGFSFVMAPKGRVIEKVYDEEKDAALAERIRALQQIGVSRNKATIHLQIGHTTMSRIIKKFGIVFPAGGPRKAK